MALHHPGPPALISWTPVLSIGGATTGITYSTQSGRYQVAGSAVEAFFDFTLSSKGALTGAVTLSLPLTASSALPFGTVQVGYYVGMASVSGAITGYVAGSSATFGMTAATALAGLSNANLSDTTRLVGRLLYRLP